MPRTFIDLFNRVRGQRDVKRLSDDYKTLGKDVDGAQRSINNASRSVELFAAGASALAVGPQIAKAFAAPIRAAGELQFELSGVRALLRSQFDSAEELEGAMESLSSQAELLGRTTEFTASQAAQAMQNFARAGFTAEEIYQVLPGTLNLASVEQLDLATAAQIAAGTLRGAGKDASEFNEVVDLLANTTVNSANTLIDLQEAFKTSLPIANAAGVSLNELAGAVGLLANEQIKGTVASTNLRNIIGRLTGPTSESEEALRKLGLTFDEFKDAEGNFIGLSDSIRVIDKALADTQGNADRLDILTSLFGKQGASGFAILLRKGADSLDEFTKKTRESGTAAQIAEDRLDNLTGATVKLGSATEGFLITAGGPFLDFTQFAVESLTSLIGRVTEMISTLPLLNELLSIAGTLVLGLGGAFVTLGGGVALAVAASTAYSKIVTILTAKIPILSGVIAALGKVIGFLTPLVSALVLALGFVDIISRLTNGISLLQLKMSEIAQFIKNSFVRGFLEFARVIQVIRRSVNEFLGDESAAQAAQQNIDLIDAQIEAIKRSNDELARSAGNRIAEQELGGSPDEVESPSLVAARKRIEAKRKKEREAAEEKERQERLKRAEEEREEKNRIEKEGIEKLQGEIDKLQQDSAIGGFDQSTFDELIKKQEELAKLRFAGDPTKQERELTRIATERQRREEEAQRQRLRATEIVKRARIDAIEDENQRELALLAQRQQRQLQDVTLGGDQGQVQEIRDIQRRETQSVLLRQAEETAMKRIELDAFVQDARIRNVEDSIAREKLLFSQRQDEELEEFKQLLADQFGLTKGEIERRVNELKKVQDQERLIFEERQKLEQQERSRQLDREFIDLELGRTRDPLEQIRLQSQLELSEFQSLQDQKLQQLREFGASEQQLEEQRLLFKKDLVEQEKQIRREAFDAQLALGQETIGSARNVAQTLLDLSKGNSKELFAVTQGLAVAEATINVARAISNSIGAQGFFGVAQAAIAGAAAAAELAKISAVTLGFNQGGIVPGNTSVNRDSVSAMLTPGEAVIPQDKVRAFGADFFNGIIRGTVSPNIANGVPGKGLSPANVRTRFNTGGIVSAPRNNQMMRPQVTVINKNELSDDVIMGIISKPGNFEIVKNKIRDEQDDIFGR